MSISTTPLAQVTAVSVSEKKGIFSYSVEFGGVRFEGEQPKLVGTLGGLFPAGTPSFKHF